MHRTQRRTREAEQLRERLLGDIGARRVVPPLQLDHLLRDPLQS